MKKQTEEIKVFKEENEQGEGGYIFISHAHKDIRGIRKIRNTLEENGFEPICFYLRCLSDDNEIIDLIKREIDSREWFLLVDSENARNSKWVQTEVEYIKEKDTSKLISVSLDDQDEILPILNRLCNSMRVFLSYSSQDVDLAKIICNACLDNDLKVFLDFYDVPPGEDWKKIEFAALKHATEKGCVVVIISSNSVQSIIIKNVLSYAATNHASILPVIVGDVELSEHLEFLLEHIQHYRLNLPISKKQIDEIVEIIERRLVEKLHNHIS